MSLRYSVGIFLAMLSGLAFAQDPSNQFDQAFIGSCESGLKASLPESTGQSDKMDQLAHSYCGCMLRDIKVHFSGDELADLMRAGLLKNPPSPELRSKIEDSAKRCVAAWAQENQS